MINKSLISQIINALPIPALVITRQNKVVAVNNTTRLAFSIDDEQSVEFSFGSLFSCHNIAGSDNCGSTDNCGHCTVNDLLAKSFERKTNFLDQNAIIYTTHNQLLYAWRVVLSVSYADFLGGDLLLVTLTNWVLEEENTNSCDIADDELVLKSEVEFIKRTDFKTDNLLRRIDALLCALFPNIDEGIIVIDVDRKIVSVNPCISMLMGEAFNVNTSSLSLWDMIDINDKTGIRSKVNEFMINESTGSISFKAAILTKSHSRIPSSFTIVPLSDYLNHSQGWIIIVKDLSKVQALQAQFEMNHDAIENAPSEYVFCDHLGQVSYANKQARIAFGWNQHDLGNENIRHARHSCSILKWNRLIRSIIKKGAIQLESSHRHISGGDYPVLISVYTIKGNDKGLLCYIANNHSVQKNTQNRLLREAVINQNMAEISRELSNVSRIDTVSLLVRQYALEITESQFCFLAYRDPMTLELVTSIYSDSSYTFKSEVVILGKYFEKTFEHDFDPILFKALNKDIPNFNVNGQLISQLLPFGKMACAAIAHNNQYVGILFVARKQGDYTKAHFEHLQNLTTLFGLAINRIQVSMVVKEMNDKLLMAMDVASLGIFDWDLKKSTIDISQRWRDIWGFAEHAPTFKISFILELIHPEDRISCLKSFILHLRNTDTPFKCICRVRNSNGIYQWVQTTGKAVACTPTGRPSKILSVHFDITEQMDLNKQLIKANDEAISASKAKSVFIARMSHEFRTPLNAINGFSDLLKNNTSDPTLLRYLNNIKKSGLSLLDLVNDLLDFSKLEVGKLALRPSPVDLALLINETIAMFLPLAVEKSLTLNLTCDGTFPKDKLWIDETRLKQVLNNLIGNAIKFTEKGGVEIIVYTYYNNNDTIFLSIEVVDTGIGIKPESQLTIFEDFVQQDGQDNRRYGGTGLGLGIVKRLVEIMQGAISLTSSPGIGSHFEVTFPHCPLAKPDLSKYTSNELTEMKMGSLMQLSNNEIIPIIKDANIKAQCHAALIDIWPAFRERPSFAKIPQIIELLNGFGVKFDMKEFKLFAARFKDCHVNFSVEDLEKSIEDFEKFADLYVLS